jgi:hypothetical protein
MEQSKYLLHFWFDWGAGCLWPGNEAMRRDFDLGPYDALDTCPLPLSQEILSRCKQLTTWHDQSLNWDYPSDPGPWRQTECDRFNAAAAALFTDIRAELGSDFEVIDRQVMVSEDPDLDAYLADPKGFRRKQQP